MTLFLLSTLLSADDFIHFVLVSHPDPFFSRRHVFMYLLFICDLFIYYLFVLSFLYFLFISYYIFIFMYLLFIYHLFVLLSPPHPHSPLISMLSRKQAWVLFFSDRPALTQQH